MSTENEETLISTPAPAPQEVKAGATAPDGTVISEDAAKALSPKVPNALDEVERMYKVFKADGSLDVEASFLNAVKSHKNAQFKLSQRKNTAPESYEKDKIVPKDIQIPDDMLDEFKKLDLSQDQVKGALELVASKLVPEFAKKSANLEKERLAVKWDMDAKSPDFTERMQRVSNWAVETIGADAAKMIARTAEGFLGLEMQMKASADRERVSVPSTPSVPQTKVQMKSELMSLVASDAYLRGDHAVHAKAQELASRIAELT